MKNILDSYRAIGIVGLAKNTGKTTTLNYLIKLYQHEKLGLTSIGLDGETLDQVNFLPKPKIMVYPGMVIATAKSCLDHSTAVIDLLNETSLLTALGPIIIGKVSQKGTVMLAGPTTNREMNQLLVMMKYYVSRIFVDGAFNRMTFSSISELDGIVLATGAAFSTRMEETVAKTNFFVHVFSAKKPSKDVHVSGSMMIKTKHGTYTIDHKSFEWFEDTLRSLREKIEYIYIKGAITQKLMNLILEKREPNMTLIMDDPTKMLVHHSWMDTIQKLNLHIDVLKPIPLLWITMNPWSPSGDSYDEHEFYHALHDVIDIAIDNVKRLENT